MSFASQTNAHQSTAQATLQHSLNALNAKIVQAQNLALINGISVDDVLSRMGGLNEIELGLLKLCAAREQEARLQANVSGISANIIRGSSVDVAFGSFAVVESATADATDRFPAATATANSAATAQSPR